MKIALGQLLVEGGEPERNLERALAMVKVAAENGADVLLLPETLDFGWTHPSALKEAHSIPGRFSDQLCRMARESNLYICAGLTERTRSGNYNAGILIDRQGEIICVHHKINLLDVELPFYLPGQQLRVVDTDFGVVGVDVCADNYIDGLSIGHTLGRMGAQIILSPSSWTSSFSVDESEDPYEDKWIAPFFMLAKMYDMYVASSTSVGYIVGGPYEGKKMVGRSLLVGPEGLVCQGEFNEFAGEVVNVNIDLKPTPAVGTAIGERLNKLGYELDDAQWGRFRQAHYEAGEQPTNIRQNRR